MDHQLGEERGAGGDENPNQEVNRQRPREAVMGQQPPARSCPRCNSNNTKFCYYNNYSLAQPRYFCKHCRRHWTHGGSLRNIPIGGGSHKSKQPKLSFSSSTYASISTNQYMVNEQQTNTSFYGIVTSVGGGLLPSLSVMQQPNLISNHGLLHGLDLLSAKTGQERPNHDTPLSLQQVVHHQQQNLYPVGMTMEMEVASSSNYNWNVSSSSSSSSNNNNNNHLQNNESNDDFQVGSD